MTTSRTVISLRVSVPVLSEQMTVTDPSVSTAGSLRTIADRVAMCRTPRASVMVTTAGSPSGTAATAKPMAADSSSSRESACSRKPMAIIAAVAAAIATTMRRPSPSISRVSGVSGESASRTRRWIRPSSVRSPVAVTTATARPETTTLPAWSMLERSATAASDATASTCLSTGSDSPVSGASSARTPRASTSRASAGARSPGCTRTMSPGTSVDASTLCHDPSRRAVACGDSIRRMPASAFSA